MNKQDTKKIMFLQTIWFTFLVVSLVACFFACIILGINSKNVAHAEEIDLSDNLRSVVSSTVSSRDNLLGNNGALMTLSSGDIVLSSDFGSDTWYCPSGGSYVVISYVSGGVNFYNGGIGQVSIYYICDSFSSSLGSSLCISWGLVSRSSSITLCSYNLTASGNTNEGYGSNANSIYYFNINKTNSSDVYFGLGFTLASDANCTLSFMKVENGSGFTGQPSNAYLPNGYDQGYLDGQNAGGSGYTEEDLEEAYQDGYDDGYTQGLEDGEEVVLPVDSYNLVGSIMTLGKVSGEFTFNGNSYNSYVGETDSFTDTSGVLYQGQYYDTQGDSDVLLGFCVNYLFKYSVKVRTICYGSESRWNRVGFNIIAIDTVDNSSYVLSRSDTTYYSEFGSLGADGTNGTYVSAEFSFSFPNNHEYRLMFVPINHSLNESRSISDGASMLIFEDTYFLTQAQGSLSYDDYNALISDAYDRGLIQGRTNGYDSGYSSGYSVGYNTGSDDAGNYTFASLLGAVFDAPITAIVGKYDSDSGTRIGGLLNFNVLGVNISGFVLALLSIGVVLFILRIFLRGV